MRRWILVLFLLLSFLIPVHVFAATSSNQFECEWTSGPSGDCRVKSSTVNCAPGFVPNPYVCFNILLSTPCNATLADCVAPTPTPVDPNAQACIPLANGATCACISLAPGESCPSTWGFRCENTSYCCSSGGAGGACGQIASGKIATPAPAGGSALTPYDPTCNNGNGVRTGLGCIPTDPQAFTNIAIPWSIAIGAGVAFLLGLGGVLMIVISAGDPEKMQAGKELITSAIMGLLVIIFAVFLLKVVGVDILKLFAPPPEHIGPGGT